jgi:hypothetical protein
VDRERGRVETGFPPLLGNISGAPLVRNGNNTAVLQDLNTTGGLVPQQELVEGKFRVSTRDTRAGTTVGTVVFPLNQGIHMADLFANHYLAADPTIAAGTNLLSPLDVFGDANGAAQKRGLRISSGTEQLSVSTYATTPVQLQSSEPYFRMAAVTGTISPVRANISTANEYENIPPRKSRYMYEYDLFFLDTAGRYMQKVVFDADPLTGIANDGTTGLSGPVGLPVDTGTTTATYLEATYLWQNNYSRISNPADANFGRALDASGTVIGEGQATRPEADVVKVDYSTRLQYNLSLGARVYDPSSSQVQSLLVSDRVQVNNVGR